MAPQTSIPTSATVLGTMGTVCWCIQLVPQIWANQRSRSTTGLPATLPLLWALASCPLGTYSIAQAFNVPVQIQPQVFGALSLVCWAQCLTFGARWPVARAVAAAVALGAVLGGVEAALVLTLRPIYARGTEWPITVVGVIAAVVLAAGLLPPYYEIWRRGGRLIGISMLFLLIDFAGAFLTLLSLVMQHHFDVLGGVQYAVCAFLEIGIFALWFIDLWVHRDERRQAKAEGVRYADWVESRRLAEGDADADAEGDDKSIEVVVVKDDASEHETV